MKKIITLILSVCVFSTFAQNVNIPDANFKKKLIEEGVDTSEDARIPLTTIKVIDIFFSFF